MKISSRSGILDDATLVVTAFIILQITVCHAAHIFNTYRLVQYDKGSQQFGSRRSGLNLVASVLPKNKISGSSSLPVFDKKNSKKQNALKQGKKKEIEEEVDY